MMRKLFFVGYFILNCLFAIAGFNLFHDGGEVLGALASLFFLWFIVWSIIKCITFQNNTEESSFFRYYFNYLIRAHEMYVRDPRTGTNRFVRECMFFLSCGSGIYAFMSIFTRALSHGLFTHELLLRYAHVALYIVIVPFMMLLISHVLDSRQRVFSIRQKLFGFFANKMLVLMLYAFSYVFPVVWILIFFFVYIETRIALTPKENNS